MKQSPIILAFLIYCWLSHDAFALQRYQTLGSTTQPILAGYHPIKEADRVILPGFRPPSAELLMRTLERRYRRSLGKSPEDIAKKAVPKIFSDGPSFARARGIYAELWYAQQHPEAGLVSRHNAPQNDLYMRLKSQRLPVGIQVKTLSGGPEEYAKAMLADSKAEHFLVPDDHVEGIREYLRKEGDRHQAEGNNAASSKAYRNRDRVGPLGRTTAELETEMRKGGQYLMREQSARYVSYGATVVLALAPLAEDLVEHGHLTDSGALRVIHATAIATTGFGIDQLMKRYKSGALRGTLRGNLITGGALLLTDTGFAIWEYGGREAVSRPQFYERLGGSIGGIGLGLAVGVPVGTQVTVWVAPLVGPWAPAVGGVAGFVTGAGAGVVGEIGGRKAARCIMGVVAAQMIIDQDLGPVHLAHTSIDDRLATLQTYPGLRGENPP